MSSSQAHLNDCLNSLSRSNFLLESSVSLLQTSTDDFPRLSTVLRQNTVFTTVPEADIIKTSSNLKNKVEPQLNSLLSRIDSELDKLAQRKQTLLQKADLQSIRLDTFNKLNKFDAEKEVVGSEEELQKLKFLRNKKQRLNYSLSRLNLQDSKRRISMLPIN